MKNRFLFIFLISLFALCGCHKDRITLEIISPKSDDTFTKEQRIDIKVTASTQKGEIIQVTAIVDTLYNQSVTEEPYNFIIPPKTFKKAGLYYIEIKAYSSEEMIEGSAVRINITE